MTRGSDGVGTLDHPSRHLPKRLVEFYGCPGRQSPRVGKVGGIINIVNEKHDCMRLRDFKLRSNLKENYINGCDFLIVRNFW